MMGNFNNNDGSSLPPSIRLTPSDEHEQLHKPRSRAGTMPTSNLTSGMMNGGFGGGSGVNAGVSAGSMGTGITEMKSMSNATSPLVTSSHLDLLILPGMESFSLGVGVSTSPNMQGVEIGSGCGGGRRLRSGSLFSTNSIWNDDNLSLHSPSHNGAKFLDNSSLHSYDLSGGSNNHGNTHPNNTSNNSNYLSPTPTASSGDHNNSTLGMLNGSAASENVNMRNRSYTTAAIPTINLSPLPLSAPKYTGGGGGGGAAADDALNGTRMKVGHSPGNNQNDINLLLDNLLVDPEGNVSLAGNTRNRAQTFSGTTPILQENLIHNPPFPPQDVYISPNSASSNPASNPAGSNLTQQAILLDDVDLSRLVTTTTFENPNLGPTKNILLDNIPQFIDASKLLLLLNNAISNNRSTGSIGSVKLTSTNSSKLALVECTSIDLAMSLKAGFNHLEIVPGISLYAAFAKVANDNVPTSTNVHENSNKNNTSKSKDSQSNSKNSKPQSVDVMAIQENLMNIVHKLTNSGSNTKIDLRKIVSLINKSISYPKLNYQDNFGPLPDPIPSRQFDSPKLRELRKILENSERPSAPGDPNDDEATTKVFSQLELEELCLAMLDELPELCYDYLGNTIVQKVFTLVESPLIKLMMVKEIAPYLTQLSIHKNGTWAIQKIINLCHKEYQQKYLIGASLKPYAVKLFNDQFGNYVLQGCSKFGSPFNDFIFETMLDNFLEISFGRFGARCIRTILEAANENYYITKEQVVLVTGLIVEFANELVVNSNGSLLITWFLDTYNGCGSTVDYRYSLLTDKFLPYLDTLCVHKLANLTILKILNNRCDLQSKQKILDSIFGEYREGDDDTSGYPSGLLEHILTENPDNTAGPLFIYKILSNPLILSLNDENDSARNARYQHFVTLRIRRVLLQLSISNHQPYKKLMDEVGISNAKLNRSIPVSNRRGKRGSRSSNSKAPITSHVASQNFVNLSQQHSQMQNSMPQSYPGPPQYMPPQQGGGSSGGSGGGVPTMVPLHGNIPSGMQPNVQGYSHPNNQQMFPNVYQQQHQQDIAVMQQLEQLSLSSVALGYNSNPSTPGLNTNQRNLFF